MTQSRDELIDIVGRILCPDDWDDPASIPRVIRSKHPLRLAEEIVAALRPEARDYRYVRANGEHCGDQ